MVTMATPIRLIATWIHPGLVQAQRYSDRYELFLGEMSHNLLFTLAEDITPGTYPLETPGIVVADQTATVSASIMVDPDDIMQGTEDYDDEVTGTITLDALGATMSGSFEFNAVFVDTDDNQQEIRKSISVTGTFHGLNVQETE
jgi:hypothetical protein